MKLRPKGPDSPKKEITMRPVNRPDVKIREMDRPDLSDQISLRVNPNTEEPAPEPENLGYGTIVGDAELLNQQDVIPIIDTRVLSGILNTFENLPEEQRRKETYITLYGYYTEGDTHSSAWVTDYSFPEIFGSETAVTMTPEDFNRIKEESKLLLEKPEHSILIVIGAAHTHPNLGADFFSKQDETIHQILNSIGVVESGGKIPIGRSKQEVSGKEGKVPVIGIVFDPFKREFTIFYKRFEDKEYKASAGLYIVGHEKADEEITNRVALVFQSDEDIKAKVTRTQTFYI